jgi:hypothetical protein
MAFSNMAQLAMLASHDARAIEWSERAIDLARRMGNNEILAHALNNASVSAAAHSDPGRQCCFASRLVGTELIVLSFREHTPGFPDSRELGCSAELKPRVCREQPHSVPF